MKKIIVDKYLNNKSAMDIVRIAYPDIKTSVIYKAFDKKDVKINGSWVKINHKVSTGDEVLIFIDEKSISADKTPRLDIVYDDENILIVGKPAGMLVQKNTNAIWEDTLDILVKKKYPSALPAHRLDRNTQGLIIFSKNEDINHEVTFLLNNNKIEKYYIAVVLGKMKKKEDSLLAYLFKDSKKSIVYISDTPKKGYVQIQTNYLVKGYIDDNTILDINIKTGRTHQIRAHLAHIGHPILGDGKYGSNRVNTVKKQKRQLLCASLLKFNIPAEYSLNYLDSRCFRIDPWFLKNTLTK